MHVLPDNPLLQYSGRIDFDNEAGPVLVFAGSYVKIRFYGSMVKMNFKCIHGYQNNYIGVIIDGKADKMLLPTDGENHTLTICSGLKENIHDVCIFKRMDSAYYLEIHSFDLSENAGLLAVEKKGNKRIEVYGDSISAGELSEAEKYCGKMDPEHFGEYNNSFNSYAAILARKMNAQLHNISQGGVALLKGTGFVDFSMEEMYDCIEYNPALGKTKKWDFSKYIPHIVIVAIGQNDAYPDNYMATDFDSDKSKNWRIHYEAFIRKLREIYPLATIICMTSIMMHDLSWDRAIGNICKKIDDDRIHHFVFSQNGIGVPGHVRGSEAVGMAQELYEFIESLGTEIFKEPDTCKI